MLRLKTFSVNLYAMSASANGWVAYNMAFVSSHSLSHV